MFSYTLLFFSIVESTSLIRGEKKEPILQVKRIILTYFNDMIEKKYRIKRRRTDLEKKKSHKRYQKISLIKALSRI